MSQRSVGRLQGGLAAGLTDEQLAIKRMQAGKSNAGKIFERFTAYAISRAAPNGTAWAVWKDTKDIEQVLGIAKRDMFCITRQAFGAGKCVAGGGLHRISAKRTTFATRLGFL